MSWKRIVVGVDTSIAASQAAVFAERLAVRAGTTCHFVHATRDPLAGPNTPESHRYRRALIEQVRAQLVDVLASAAPNAPATLTVRLGARAPVVEHLAADVDAELVVLGGKHHSALDRWVGGSTALDVARTTALPLLVTAGPAAAIRRILVALDASAAARPTIAGAERLATVFDAELRALSVLEPIPVIPNVPTPDMSAYYAWCEEELKRDVWSLIRTPAVKTVLRYGMPVETILREAAQWQADLVVVGSHGKGWTERLLLGSVTERLLNQLPTSLLIIPAAVKARKRQRAERAPEGVAAFVVG
jgi:nucleotide-binding universal stress UspA family protein